jgi:hypothetical protein
MFLFIHSSLGSVGILHFSAREWRWVAILGAKRERRKFRMGDVE